MNIKVPKPDLYRSNPDCKTTHVLLRMSAEELDPATISKELRLTPTHSFKKGDTSGAGRRAVIRQGGVWQLSSEGKVRSTNPERHAKYILKKLEPNSHALQNTSMQTSISLISISGGRLRVKVADLHSAARQSRGCQHSATS